MQEEQNPHDTYFPKPADDRTGEETAGVKVYERPARRTVPMWLWLGLMVLVLVLTWIAINVIG